MCLNSVKRRPEKVFNYSEVNPVAVCGIRADQPQNNVMVNMVLCPIGKDEIAL